MRLIILLLALLIIPLHAQTGTVTPQKLAAQIEAVKTTPTITGMASISPTSGGNSQILRVGNTANIPVYGSALTTGQITGVLSVYANGYFGILAHSHSSEALIATTVDGEAIKCIQKNQSFATTDTPVVRLLRQAPASGIAEVTSPMVVISDEASAHASGGPVIKVLKNKELVFMIDNRGRPVLKDTSGGGYHAIQVSSNGTLSTEVVTP